MVRDGHTLGWTNDLTSTQVAKMLWLSFIGHDQASVESESCLLVDGRRMPQEGGEEDGDTVIAFFAQLVRNSRLASDVLAIEIDGNTREVKAEMRDSRPVVFSVPGETVFSLNNRDRLTVGGSFLSRATLAYFSRVWLTVNQPISHV